MYNKAILIGRLTADPEMRTTQNGTNVASFRIAVDRSYGGEDRKTDFFNIVCWRKSAEFVCRYFSKGQKLGVEGEIQTRDYTDKDGIKRYAFEIVASRLFFVESKGASCGQQLTPASDAAADIGVVEEDDLPF